MVLGYSEALAIMAVISGLLVLYFKRREWLGGTNHKSDTAGS